MVKKNKVINEEKRNKLMVKVECIVKNTPELTYALLPFSIWAKIYKYIIFHYL